MIRAALISWLLLCAVGVQQGWCGAPGGVTARTAAGWWQARQFDAAALNSDLEGMERLGRKLERDLGAEVPLLLAAHRLGFQVTAPSFALPPEEAQAWAMAALGWLTETMDRMGDPWDARRLQADIIVNRPVASGCQAQGEAAAADWFAAGGGPFWSTSAPRDVYWTALGLPAQERPAFFASCLRILAEAAE